jgi:hypothetical protein
LGVYSKSQIPNHKSQINYNDQNTKIPNGIQFVLRSASINYAALYNESTKALKHEKLNSWIFLLRLVSVIDNCDLGFVCYLVLEIWNLFHAGCSLLTYSLEPLNI